MKIISTAILLGITLLAVPLFTWFAGTAPGAQEWAAIRTLLIVAGVSIALCFFTGELTGNNSQVDKLWSVLPVIYVWIVAAYGDFSPRLILMAMLVTIWGVRLTANFAMKGAYRWKIWEGEEDYRWQVLRLRPEFRPKWKWTLFNLFFISGYQNVLILLFSLPSVVVLQYNDIPPGAADMAVAALMMLFIVYETVADIQQWRYQRAKWALIRAGATLTGNYRKGFLDKGLWAFSRHPNYFAEQAIWVCFYLFTISAGAFWFNWSVAGCLLLMLLFQGSSNFSEEISAGKYPEYKQYQEKVSRFIPFPKRS